MPAVAETLDTVQSVTQSAYKWGFETDIEMDVAPKGLTEDTIRMISSRKEEPQWLLDWRLQAFAAWQTMQEPDWAKLGYPKIDYQDIHYYAAPKKGGGPKSLDEVDPELLRYLREARHSAEGAARCWRGSRSRGVPRQCLTGWPQRGGGCGLRFSVSVATTFQRGP